MPKVHGKGTFVSLGGSDLSQYGSNMEFERTSDAHDVTTYGNDAHRKFGGLLDGTSTISGFYDSTAGTGPRAVIEPKLGTVVALVHRPEGTGAGRPQDTVQALVTSYTESSPVADMVTWECEVEFDGDVISVTQ
jgi:hypothetical protein